MEWIQIKTLPGRAENAARIKDLPKGPFFVVPQHKMDDFLRSPFTYSGECKKLKEFLVEYGAATFAVGEDLHTPILVGYHYDTSD